MTGILTFQGEHRTSVRVYKQWWNVFYLSILYLFHLWNSLQRMIGKIWSAKVETEWFPLSIEHNPWAGTSGEQLGWAGRQIHSYKQICIETKQGMLESWAGREKKTKERHSSEKKMRKDKVKALLWGNGHNHSGDNLEYKRSAELSQKLFTVLGTTTTTKKVKIRSGSCGLAEGCSTSMQNQN